MEWLSPVEWLALAQLSTAERVPRWWQEAGLWMVPVLQSPAAKVLQLPGFHRQKLQAAMLPML
jgi:hypothetical protein